MLQPRGSYRSVTKELERAQPQRAIEGKAESLGATSMGHLSKWPGCTPADEHFGGEPLRHQEGSGVSSARQYGQ